MSSKFWNWLMEHFPDKRYLEHGVLVTCFSCLLALFVFLAIDSIVIVGDGLDAFLFLLRMWPLLIVVYCISLVPTVIFALIILYLLRRMKNKLCLTISRAIWIGAISGFVCGFLLCAFFLLIPSAHNAPAIRFIIQEWRLVIFYGERIFTVMALGACAGISTSWYAARYLLRDKNLYLERN